jgi:hypothetical protein
MVRIRVLEGMMHLMKRKVQNKGHERLNTANLTIMDSRRISLSLESINIMLKDQKERKFIRSLGENHVSVVHAEDQKQESKYRY